MSGIEIRELGVADWELYRQLRLQSLKESPDAFGSTYQREAEFFDEQWIDRAGENQGVYKSVLFAVEIDGSAVGLASGVVHSSVDDIAHLYQMWLGPAARGKGAGKLLLDSVIQWSEKVGAAKLQLGVTIGNSAAVSLYESKGFVATGKLNP